MSEIEPVDAQKVNEDNPQSRYSVLNAPILAPGTCILCKSPGGDGRQFIDLGIQVNWIGAMYFCTYCVAEAASMIGMIPRKAHDELEEVFNSNWELHREVSKELREKLDAAAILLRDCRCGNFGPGVTEPTSDVEADSDPEQPDSDTDESGDVEESGDVSESSGDDESAVVRPKRTRASKSTE